MITLSVPDSQRYPNDLQKFSLSFAEKLAKNLKETTKRLKIAIGGATRLLIEALGNNHKIEIFFMRSLDMSPEK